MTKNEKMLLIATVLWGFSAPLNRIILQNTHELTFLWVRFLSAAIILTMIYRKKINNIDVKTIKYGFLLGLLVATGFAFELIGTRIMNPAKLYFIISIQTVIIPLLAYIIYREKTSRKEILSAIIASTGLIIINMNGGDIVLGVGELVAIVCTLIYSFIVIFMAKNNKKYDNMLITIFMMYGAGIVGVILNLVIDSKSMYIQSEGLIYMVIAIIFTTIIPFILEMKAFKDIHPTRAGIIYALTPIVALGAVMLILKEFLTIQGYIGSFVILIALLYSNVRKRKECTEG